MTTLYHKDIGFPKSLALPQAGLPLAYSNHAIRAAAEDRLSTLPKALPPVVQVVEAEYQEGQLTKWVVRVPSERPGYDLVLALLRSGFVKTVWLNSQSDNHRTLDRRRYARP